MYMFLPFALVYTRWNIVDVATLLTYIRWLWAYAIAPLQTTNMSGSVGSRALTFSRTNQWLHEHGFYDPTNFSHLTRLKKLHEPFREPFRGAFRDIRTLWCCIWYSFSILFTLIAAMTAIGGTLSKPCPDRTCFRRRLDPYFIAMSRQNLFLYLFAKEVLICLLVFGSAAFGCLYRGYM